ncbi:MAG TPA: PilW family protein [Burkholderiales bacterium]|nr:PilW family protein [Burkholderiales bacterium]
MTAHAFPRRTAAAGFTLVELLIAMTIGLLLTAVIAQVFLGSRKTYATTDDVARMQENMRYVHDALSRNLRMAGYMSTPATFPISTPPYQGVFSAPNPLALTGAEGGTATASDSITVSFQGDIDSTTADCLGRRVLPGVMATSTFSIGADPDRPGNIPSLLCASSLGGAAAETRALVNDVENMQILYGEDTNGDLVNADRYVSASEVTNMDAVVSVRIALLFRTANIAVRSSADPTQYQLHAVKLPAFSGTDATRIRRTMSFTVALRNREP